MNNKAILTGSLGFIASNLIRKSSFDKSSISFAGIDKALYPNQLNNIYNGKIIANNYISDITDKHIIENIFQLEKPDTVIHTASYVPLSNHIDEIKQCIHTNSIGTQILLDACTKYGVNKFIYLSSDSLYKKLNIDSKSRSSEIDDIHPTTPLAMSQALAENLIINSGINYNIIRMSNVYGPRQYSSGIIPNTIFNILNNKQINVNYAMDLSDWTHVFDVSSAILLILKSNLYNEIINLSSAQECSNLELIQFVCNAMKRGHELIYCNNTNNNPKKYLADNTKLLKLGWKPSFKLRQGIQETCDWYDINKYYLK